MSLHAVRGEEQIASLVKEQLSRRISAAFSGGEEPGSRALCGRLFCCCGGGEPRV